MRNQEIIGLWEAYASIYAHPQEEVEQLDEAMSSYDRNRQRAARRAAERNAARDRGQTGNVPGVGYVSPRRERETYTDSAGVERHKTGAKMPKREDQKESFDLFDVILDHLISEGYADTNEAALAIMANMSEEWKQDIVEDIRGAITYNPNTPIGKLKRRIKGSTPEKREARTRAYQGNRSDAAERYGASQRNPYDDNRGDIPSLRGR